MSNLLTFSMVAAVSALTSVSTASGMDLSFNPSAPSASVGTAVRFTAAAPDTPDANLWYRFRVREQGGAYQMIRDYGPESTLEWTATKHEGRYDVEVSVRDLDAGDQATAILPFQFQSMVTAGQPVISPTANSLVFLYSAPPCALGARMRVQFQSSGVAAQSTPFEACTPGFSMNFYLAGLQANRTYTAHQIVNSGNATVAGPDLIFTTGDVPAGLYTDTVLVPSKNPASEPILLGGPLGDRPVAHDLAGNVLWYGPEGVTFLTRIEAAGAFWGILEAPGSDRTQQIVRKFDLMGMTLLETNAARVSEQLVAIGKRQITGFHHEARSLADGRVVVLAAVEQVLTDVQSPGSVDVLGDMIIVLDRNLNVLWTWDAFDNLDVNRAAILKETCPNAGCPAIYLADTANDWTHGNAVQETADGNFLYSCRNQDWLIKIAYNAGIGDGHVIWKLGRDGDFQIDSADPYPWFSHQHDGNFDNADASKVLVFDDGNTRIAAQKGGHSRGQVLKINEPNRVASLLVNADLGQYAAAVGSAQALRDGNFHFNAGFVQENDTIDSYSLEVTPSGEVQYEAHQNVILYRTFRLTDIYSPY